MQDILSIVANSISEVCDVEASQVTPDKHIFADLGIDSLAFLDVVYEIDRVIGVKLPIEDWLAEHEQSNISEKEFFRVENFVRFIARITAQSSKVEA